MLCMCRHRLHISRTISRHSQTSTRESQQCQSEHDPVSLLHDTCDIQHKAHHPAGKLMCTAALCLPRHDRHQA